MEPGRIPRRHADIILWYHIEGQSVIVVGEESRRVRHTRARSQQDVLLLRASVALYDFYLDPALMRSLDQRLREGLQTRLE